MSGHSKWATIKRKKAKVDAARGKVFTQISKEILLAAKQGGGDPDNNLRLKNAIIKAKEANLPNDNIQRAIMKGTGELGGGTYEEILYEGYGPAGVAVMVEATTNNRNRTAGEIRHLFSKNGGNLGESGCVAWMFEKKGMLVVEKESGADEDELMMDALDAGAEDVRVEDDVFEIITEPENFDGVRDALEGKGYQLAEAQVSMIPKTTVKIEGNQEEQMYKLLDALEELDDVDEVHSNFETE